jgi:hypothetical protein
MTDSTVEDLTDVATAGGISGSDLLYVFRPGSPDADYKAQADVFAAASHTQRYPILRMPARSPRSAPWERRTSQTAP